MTKYTYHHLPEIVDKERETEEEDVAYRYVGQSSRGGIRFHLHFVCKVTRKVE